MLTDTLVRMEADSCRFKLSRLVTALIDEADVREWTFAFPQTALRYCCIRLKLCKIEQ